MRNYWLNLVLSLTNRIYQLKQSILELSGFKIVGRIIRLIFYEFILAIISFPLYLVTKSDKVTAFFAEKGSYSKVSFDYNLRRILTFSSVGLLIVVWLLKLAVASLVPLVYGPIQLYEVSNFYPENVTDTNLISSEIEMETAEISNTIVRPEILEVRKINNGDYFISGKGQPNTAVVLLLSAKQTVTHLTEVGLDGRWSIKHKQEYFHLNEGNHAMVAFSYDGFNKIRGQASPTQYFKVTESWFEKFIENIDSFANWSIAVVILFGAFLILLTI